MNKNIFYKYIGSNKAIYIVNLSSFRNIKISLEFYKPLGRKRKLLKNIFCFYLFLISLLSKIIRVNSLLSVKEVEVFLLNKLNKQINYNLDSMCSVFISSSGDKVIVNHQNVFFEKFAFYKSYKKACNEVAIYKILNKKNYNFLLSNIKDINIEKDYCSFKLYNDFLDSQESNVDDSKIADSLVDFFNVVDIKTKSLNTICQEISKNDYINKKFIEYIVFIQNEFEDINIRVGLTHWDFKIWNIQAYTNKILIYDFEEAKVDGLPLEDLLNYYIDAKVMAGESSDDILLFIKSSFFENLVQYYMKKLEIDTNSDLLLMLYLLNRIVFYSDNGGEYVVKQYVELLEKTK